MASKDVVLEKLGNIVNITGQIYLTSVASDETILTLPTGFRPTATRRFVMVNSSATPNPYLYTNGKLIPSNSITAGWYFFSYSFVTN